MSENTFAFLIHPLDPVRDVARKYPGLATFPGWLIELLSIFYPPVYISEITGLRSQTSGQLARGWFVACPLSARMMVTLPPALVYRKIIQSGRLAERLGARILGLGAFTSVVGDGGITVNNALSIPVTTGNSYTVATSLQAVHHVAERIQLNLTEATVAIVGATGAIGSVCARILAPDVQQLILVGRRAPALQIVADAAFRAGAKVVEATTEIDRIKMADVVLSVTSTLQPLLLPQHLRPGAIVCDVARPRDVARAVVSSRPDVLVFDGGTIQPPGAVDFGFNFGFPKGLAYACMAETMALALEGRFEAFTLGKELQLERVTEIERIAARHGFALAGLRSFDRALSENEVNAVASHRTINGLVGKPAAPVMA